MEGTVLRGTTLNLLGMGATLVGLQVRAGLRMGDCGLTTVLWGPCCTCWACAATLAGLQARAGWCGGRGCRWGAGGRECAPGGACAVCVGGCVGGWDTPGNMEHICSMLLTSG